MGMYVYKMFNKGLVCRGYKFKEGLNECDHATCVREGFHAAENPLDCLSYYPDFDNSECWLCYADGDIHEDGTDSKISCTRLEILRRLEKHEFVVEAVTYMLEHSKRPHNALIKRDEAKTDRNGIAIVIGKEPRAKAMVNGAVIALIRENADGKPDQIMIIYGEQVRKGECYLLRSGGLHHGKE
jgi:hypothetical protein